VYKKQTASCIASDFLYNSRPLPNKGMNF